MTACVNETEKKAKGGVFQSKVLRAAMAGVLAVGMMPAMALAAEPAESEAVPMAVSPVDDFEAGAVTGAVDNDDKAVDTAERAEWTVDEKAHYVIPTQVTPKDSDPIILAQDENDWWEFSDESNAANTFEIAYYKANENGAEEIPGTDPAVKGDVVKAATITEAGTYYLVVTGTAGEYNGAAVSYEFGIAAKSLEGATAYQVNADDLKDVSDSEFVFNNDTLAISSDEGDGALNFELDGKPLASDDINWAAIKIYREAGSDADAIKYTDIKGGDGIKLYAGNYTAVIAGNPGSDYEGSEAQVDFTVKPFDVATADIALATQTAGSTKSRVGVESAGEGNENVAAILVAEYTGDEGVLSKAGTYTFKVSLNPDSVEAETDNEDRLEASVVNTKEVSLVVLEQGAANLQETIYCGEDKLKDHVHNVNLSDSKTLFDVEDIVVKNGDEELADDKYEITVTDAEGNEADVDDLSTPGTWKVTVTVDPAANEYKLYGSATMTVEVIAGTVNIATDVFFKYDGKVTDGVTATYNGTDLLDKLEVIVKTDDGEKTLVEGTDYDVKVTDPEGKETTEVVNANDNAYTVEITSDSWKMNTTDYLKDSIQIKVNPIDPTSVRVAGTKTLYTTLSGKEATGDTGLPHTGSEIVPTFEYTTDDLTKVDAEDATWTVLPEGAYDATYSCSTIADFEDGDAIVDKGEYSAELAKNVDEANKVVAGNYDVDGDNVNFKVIDTETFADVPAIEWFAEPVTMAEVLGYINGYYGTKIFGAADQITRADVACILFNMAGNNINEMDEGSIDELKGYATGFSDVDQNMYYAAAIGWAAKTGVVNGYDEDTFGPNDKITREQTAAMISNYAKALGKHQAVADADATLAEFGDGSQVSDWAKAEVAWAVENGVMGNGGYLAPTDQITRAEIAAMAVNYQPAKL